MTLLDRLKAASGPDRELDYLIFMETAEKEVANHWHPSRGNFFTGSVEAALTLIPKGWSHGYRWNATHKNVQAYCEYIPKAPFKPEELLTTHSGKCNIIPIAICIAAIQAKGHDDE